MREAYRQRNWYVQRLGGSTELGIFGKDGFAVLARNREAEGSVYILRTLEAMENFKQRRDMNYVRVLKVSQKLFNGRRANEDIEGLGV